MKVCITRKSDLLFERQSSEDSKTLHKLTTSVPMMQSNGGSTALICSLFPQSNSATVIEPMEPVCHSIFVRIEEKFTKHDLQTFTLTISKTLIMSSTVMVLLTKPESEFDCEIQDLLRSTFLISSGSTSTWSVVVTSQPNKAIPKGEANNFKRENHQDQHLDIDMMGS